MLRAVLERGCRKMLESLRAVPEPGDTRCPVPGIGIHYVAGLQFADTARGVARSWVREALEKRGLSLRQRPAPGTGVAGWCRRVLEGVRRQRPERRGMPRTDCRLPAICGRGHRRTRATLMDIGPGGVSMSLGTPLLPGDCVDVHAGGAAPGSKACAARSVRCRVVWCRTESSQGGVRQDKSEQRESAREPSDIKVHLLTPDGRLLGEARVTDFSALGVRLESCFRMTEISKILICFDPKPGQAGRLLRGQVRYWIQGDRGSFVHGVRFLDRDLERTRYLESRAGCAPARRPA